MKYDKSIIQKEKVIREFREEVLKKKVDQDEFEIPFQMILNCFFRYRPSNVVPSLKKHCLTMLAVIDQTSYFVEWTPQRTLVSITKMTDNFDDGGIYQVALEDAIKIINKHAGKL